MTKYPAIHWSYGNRARSLSIWRKRAACSCRRNRGNGAIQWLTLQMSTMGPMFGQYIHFLRHAIGENIYALERYRAETHRLCAVVNERLDQAPYLGGDAYSIADIAAYPWIRLLHGELVERELMPNADDYLDRIGSRPAVVRAEAIMAKTKRVDVEDAEAATPAQFDRIFNRAATT